MKRWHPFAHNAQRSATVSLAVFGVVAAWVWGVTTRSLQLSIPWWFDTPAVFGFYGIIYGLYDKLLWKFKPFRTLHGIPDLNGRYNVTIKTSYDGHTSSHNAVASIAQSWSHMAIRLEANTSTSLSSAAWLSETPGAGFTITYVYINTPKSSAPSSLTPHEGTAVLTFDQKKRATGEYYNGRGRTNHGELTFEPQ